MGKPKFKPEIKTETVRALVAKWNVVVLNDPINLTGYVVLVFMNVLRISRGLARKHMLEVHEEGRSTVWTGEREHAEMLVMELQQWHLNALLEKDV